MAQSLLVFLCEKTFVCMLLELNHLWLKKAFFQEKEDDGKKLKSFVKDRVAPSLKVESG